MVTRTRRSRVVMEVNPDENSDTPMARALDADNERMADTVVQLLDDLRSVITEDSQILIYKMPKNGGTWEYLKTLSPPINAEGILDELKGEYGGGRYMFRVRADGKIVTGKMASIAGPPKTPREEGAQGGVDTMTLTMIEQQRRSSSESMQMFMTMMQQSQAQSQQMMQIMQAGGQQSQQMIVTLVTALAPALIGLMGNKTDPVAQFSAMAAIMKPAEGEPKNSLAETIATIAAVKELFSGESGGGGDGDGSFFGSLIKTMGPGAIDAITTMMKNAPAPVQQVQPALPPPPQYRPSVPAPQYNGPPPVSPYTMPALYPTPVSPYGTVAQIPTEGNAPPRSAVLEVIGEDVLYFARRDIDPAIAAEAVLQRLSRAQVSNEQIMGLVFQFNQSPDWIADLATQGIDLSQRREWANSFLAELIEQYTDNQGENPDSAGGGGGETDPGADGAFEP